MQGALFALLLLQRVDDVFHMVARLVDHQRGIGGLHDDEVVHADEADQTAGGPDSSNANRLFCVCEA